MSISNIKTDHYSIPLPVVLSDSMHGDMASFELMTIRIENSNGVQGLGYTYTLGAGAKGIHSVMRDDMAPFLLGKDEARIEQIWKSLWWKLHYAGRGGLAIHALSAVDIALWDLMGKQVGMPLWRLLGGADPKIKAYAGGIDLMFPEEELLAQTEKLEVALVDTSIQKLLHAHAQEHGCIPKRELRQWLEYPRKPGTTRAMVQHHAGHVDHLHARFRCEEDDKRCKRR